MKEKATGPLVIFGLNPVLEKLRSAPDQVYELMVVRGHESPRLNAVVEAARRLGLPVHYVDTGRLNFLAEGGTHQGVAASTAPHAYQPFSDLLQALAAAGRERILVLDGITDPRNFGALLRCADAAGVQHVVIPKDRSVGVTPVVVKSSAGAAN
jgi:23S rRNA (guanosine2251-2'-O)-methyltransferase